MKRQATPYAQSSVSAPPPPRPLRIPERPPSPKPLVLQGGPQPAPSSPIKLANSSYEPRAAVQAPQPPLATLEVQVFILLVATEIYAMLQSKSFLDYLIAYVKSPNVKRLLSTDPNKVFLFYLKGGAATTIAKEHFYSNDKESIFNFTSDLDFSIIVNPSLPIDDFRTVRAILFAATIDLMTNIAGTFKPDVPHILKSKNLRKMNELTKHFNTFVELAILEHDAMPLNNIYTNRVFSIPYSESADDLALVSGSMTLRQYAYRERQLGPTSSLAVNINMNIVYHDKPLHFSSISLNTRSKPSFPLLDIVFPTSDNSKAQFDWDLAEKDIQLFETRFVYRKNDIWITFPVVGPVANFVDQIYAALPFTETRPAKVAARRGRAAILVRNIIRPHVANLAKTIKNVSAIRFKNQTPNGHIVTRKAGNLLREALGANYPLVD